jgi:signal transduction histidine kinase
MNFSPRRLLRRAWRRISLRLLASYLLIGLAAVGSTGTLFLYTSFRAHSALPIQTEFQRNLLQGTLSALVVAICASIGVSLFVSRRILEPIQRLITASSRIANGNYEERVKIADDFEIAELAASFNRMAEALEQTEQQRQALIADVAHELRTPLTTIKGYMEALIDGVVAADAETFALIYHEADRMYRLVRDLQELSRLEAGQMVLDPRPLAVAEMVRGVTGRMQPQFDAKGVELSATVAADTGWVYADSDRLQQVLLNLLANALQYTSPGGRVVLRAFNERDKVCVVVQDTGIGIPPEHLSHIFARFYRVDKSRSRRGGGTGIGLTIVKHLVEAHGGSIAVASVPALGSTFTVALPQAAPGTRQEVSGVPAVTPA